MDRIIGDFSVGIDGPTLVCVGGIHGNEPAGTVAAERVVRRLAEDDCGFRGRLLALRGNVPALEAGRRYVDRDLNRLWGTPPAIEARDHFEMMALGTLIEHAMARAGEHFRVLDLHTTSGPTIPFFWLTPFPGARETFEPFDMPVVYEEGSSSGTLVGYMAGRGVAALLAEGGHHSETTSADHLEAVVWISLVGMGCLPDHVPEYARSREILRHATGGERSLYEVVYTHAIGPDDEFRMRPGYTSFQDVGEGELLAYDATGEIRSPSAGKILMPLYALPCDEGFLIIREADQWPRSAI